MHRTQKGNLTLSQGSKHIPSENVHNLRMNATQTERERQTDEALPIEKVGNQHANSLLLPFYLEKRMYELPKEQYRFLCCWLDFLDFLDFRVKVLKENGRERMRCDEKCFKFMRQFCCKHLFNTRNPFFCMVSMNRCKCLRVGVYVCNGWSTFYFNAEQTCKPNVYGANTTTTRLRRIFASKCLRNSS